MKKLFSVLLFVIVIVSVISTPQDLNHTQKHDLLTCSAKLAEFASTSLENKDRLQIRQFWMQLFDTIEKPISKDCSNISIILHKEPIVQELSHFSLLATEEISHPKIAQAHLHHQIKAVKDLSDELYELYKTIPVPEIKQEMKKEGRMQKLKKEASKRLPVIYRDARRQVYF